MSRATARAIDSSVTYSNEPDLTVDAFIDPRCAPYATPTSVASGLKPYPDGLTWLKGKGYRTVLHVRLPGQDDSADRELIEKRGLRYLSLEVSPETLTEEKIKDFNRVVNDEGNLPLFVYDKEGMLAGGLWYLYLRTSEMVSEDEARTKAASLGFKPDEHKAMWQAIQKYFTGAGR